MKVYISYPMNPEKHNLTEITKIILKHKVFASIPPPGQLESKKIGAELDRLLIEKCEEVWAFGKIGRDCAWELGYAVGLGKNVRIFINDENRYILFEDWMTLINAEICEIGDWL